MAQDFLLSPSILFLILVWTLPWKGVALWKAANNRQKGWFIAILILNTLAILEIIYIFYFSKKQTKFIV
jgi:methionyl-tRNA synthetase